MSWTPSVSWVVMLRNWDQIHRSQLSSYYQRHPKAVLSRLAQSKTPLWSLWNTADGDGAYRRQGVCSFIIYPANSSSLGQMAYTGTHWAHADPHMHTDCTQSARCTHSHKENFLSLSTMITTISTLLSYNLTNSLEDTLKVRAGQQCFIVCPHLNTLTGW